MYIIVRHNMVKYLNFYLLLVPHRFRGISGDHMEASLWRELCLRFFMYILLFIFKKMGTLRNFKTFL